MDRGNARNLGAAALYHPRLVQRVIEHRVQQDGRLWRRWTAFPARRLHPTCARSRAICLRRALACPQDIVRLQARTKTCPQRFTRILDGPVFPDLPWPWALGPGGVQGIKMTARPFAGGTPLLGFPVRRAVPAVKASKGARTLTAFKNGGRCAAFFQHDPRRIFAQRRKDAPSRPIMKARKSSMVAGMAGLRRRSAHLPPPRALPISSRSL
jgi:hypothetical protein